MICCDDVYGGTQRYLRNFTAKNFKIDVSFVNLQDLEKVKGTIRKGETKLLWIETPTNPTMKLCDIEELCKLCKDNGVISVADNTFATPVLQSPLLLGADICVSTRLKHPLGQLRHQVLRRPL